MRVLLSFLLLVCGWHTLALGQDNSEGIRRAVEAHLKRQILGLPGRASFTIDSIQAMGLAPCAAHDVSASPGAPAWGRSSVRVRCVSGASWSLLVPVRIQVIGPYVLSARPISSGQLIEAGDIHVQEGDLSELPPNVVTDSAQAIGRIARSSLPAGRPLRTDALRAPTVVQQGQSIKVISRGPGFEVANEGKALGNAVAGQVVQVRLSSGQVVSGIADAGGNVEVNF